MIKSKLTKQQEVQLKLIIEQYENNIAQFPDKPKLNVASCPTGRDDPFHKKTLDGLERKGLIDIISCFGSIYFCIPLKYKDAVVEEKPLTYKKSISLLSKWNKESNEMNEIVKIYYDDDIEDMYYGGHNDEYD